MPRPSRPHPADLCADWPLRECDDPAGETARLIALRLRAAIGERSLREVQKSTGVDRTSIAALLAGRSWSDLATLAKLEHGLDSALWPPRESQHPTGL